MFYSYRFLLTNLILLYSVTARCYDEQKLQKKKQLLDLLMEPKISSMAKTSVEEANIAPSAIQEITEIRLKSTFKLLEKPLESAGKILSIADRIQYVGFHEIFCILKQNQLEGTYNIFRKINTLDKLFATQKIQRFLYEFIATVEIHNSNNGLKMTIIDMRLPIMEDDSIVAYTALDKELPPINKKKSIGIQTSILAIEDKYMSLGGENYKILLNKGKEDGLELGMLGQINIQVKGSATTKKFISHVGIAEIFDLNAHSASAYILTLDTPITTFDTV